MSDATAVSDDSDLLARLRAGEDEAYEELVRLYGGRMLAAALKGVVAQNLLKKKGGGRVAALEVLVVTPAVASLVRDGKTEQII